MKKHEKCDWICLLEEKSLPYRNISLVTSTVGHKTIKPWTIFLIRTIETAQLKNVYLKKKQIGNMNLTSFFLVKQKFFQGTMAWALKWHNSHHRASVTINYLSRLHWASEAYEKLFSIFSFYLLHIFQKNILILFHGFFSKV